MAKFFVKWGKDPVIRKLTFSQEQDLKKRLNESAKNSNGFTITLSSAEYPWVKNHLGNGVMEIIRSTDRGGYWVAIGTDKRALTLAKIEALR